MAENRTAYRTGVLSTAPNPVKIDTEASALRNELRNVKVQLMSLLVAIDKALGDEPSVLTRAERRRR